MVTVAALILPAVLVLARGHSLPGVGEPRHAFGSQVDNPLQRQRRNVAAHHELHRTFRWHIGKGNLADAGQALDKFRPVPGAARDLRRSAGEHERQ